MSKEFYFKVIDEVEVEESKRNFIEKIGQRFRQRVKERTGLDLQDFNLRWILPITKNEYDRGSCYDRILKLLAEMGAPESEPKYSKEEDNICGFFLSKYQYSIRKKPKRFIYLRADLPLKKLGETFLHELFHCFQNQVDPLGLLSEARAREAEGLLNKILDEVKP